jgi:hypothetical protein
VNFLELDMTYEQAIVFFKTGKAIAKALSVSPGRISQCKNEGGFSYQTQCVLEKASGGALEAKVSDVPVKRSP